MVKAAIVGAGAIGCACAAALQTREDVDLTLCARRRDVPDRVRLSGGEEVPLRAAVEVDPAAVEAVDWLLLAVKAHQTEGAARWLAALAGRATTVVVLQNGVHRAEAVAPLADGAEVLQAIVWIGATVADGAVQVGRSPFVRVADDGAGRAFAELLAPTWLRAEATPDILTDAWRKLTLNAVAGLMALSGRPAAMFRRADVLELARVYARECAAVARADGAGISPEEGDSLADMLAAAPPEMTTSILVDRRRDAELEWEARNGVVRELGARYGVPTPVSDVVVPLLAAASGS